MTTRSLVKFGIAFALLACGCGRTTSEGVGGETNWLRSCVGDATCGDYGSCTCGLCSDGCDQDDDCPSGLICQPSVSALVTNACGAESEHGICAPECTADRDCAAGQACIQRACAPAASGATGDSMADAYIVNAIKPDAECNAFATSKLIAPVGAYDLARDYPACQQSYRPTFKLASFVEGIIQVSGAEVRLMDATRSTIVFDLEQLELPNPFEIIASQTLLPEAGELTLGALSLELIPALYARQLDSFAGQQLLAEIKVHALDESNRPLNVPPFVYVIDVCDGCMTLCAAVIPADFSPEEIYGSNTCIDNTAADGRVCVDNGCTTR